MPSVELEEPTRKRFIFEQRFDTPLSVQLLGDAVNGIRDGLLYRREFIPAQQAWNQQIPLLFVSPHLMLIENSHVSLLADDTPSHGGRMS
jgi:hypothetical protein